MALPSAPVEGSGSKISFLVWDDGGNNEAAVWQAIKTATLNGEVVGWAGIATHTDGMANAGSQPVVLSAGSDGGTILALLTDDAGRQQIVGAAPHGSPATGAPVLIAGAYQASPGALDNGDAGILLTDFQGRLVVVGAQSDNTEMLSRPIAVAIRYQATVSEVSDGYVTIPRATIRRAVITAADLKEEVIANGTAITDTANHDFDLDIKDGWRSLSIYIENTHDQAANIAVMAGSNGSPEARLYAESAIVAATSGVLLLAASEPATGAQNYVSIPALNDPIGTLRVRVSFGVAPSSGDITITVIARS